MHIRKDIIIGISFLTLFGCAKASDNQELTTHHDKETATSIGLQPATTLSWQLGAVLDRAEVMKQGISQFFSINPISDAILKRMQEGGSYPRGCTIARADLRYLKVLYVNYRGETVCGELVCNKAIAQDLIEIFTELYRQSYQIERMELIDNYNAVDDQSMRHNNTSSFCYRTVAGSKTLSKHARGMAIDINPLHNPYVKRDANGKIVKIQPDTPVAREYAARTPRRAHVIDTADLCYKLFRQHGFTWGGSWRSFKDYQHFEK